jgi:hypothetical protein
MKLNLVVTITLLSLLATASCKKNDSSVKPHDVNAQGEYFNCVINGKYWTYKELGPYSMGDPLKARENQIDDPGYQLVAQNLTDLPQTAISLWIVGKSFPDKDSISLGSHGSVAYAEVTYPDGQQLDNYTYTTRSTQVGMVIFTKRTPERLEGTFHFDATNDDASKSLHITQGQFSIIP